MGAITDGTNRQRAGKIVNSHQDDKGFRDRLNAAAAAKKAALEKFRAKARADDAAASEPKGAGAAISTEGEVAGDADAARRDAGAARKRRR